MKTVSFTDDAGRLFQFGSDEELKRVARKSTGFELETVRGSDVANGDHVIIELGTALNSPWMVVKVNELTWRDAPEPRRIESL